MLSNQKPSGDKLGLGFISLEASTSGTKYIKFVKSQKETSPGGGPLNKGGPHIAEAAPKEIMGPPVCSPGSEKSVSFQKSILGPRPKHIMICLGVDLVPDEWIKDSGCSKHMTGNRKLFSSYKAYNGGNVIFGSNLRGNIIGKGKICDNECRVTFSEHDSESTKDGKVIDENSMLWHRRLGHANMCLIQSLASKELVRNLPKLKFDQHFCDACKIGKQAHASHKVKNIVSTTRCLELLHMDLFGSSAVRSYGAIRMYNRVNKNHHGREFDNEVQFGEFCNANGITHNFSAPRTPQSNDVVERKNGTLQEMSRKPTLDYFRVFGSKCFTVDTSIYILNGILIRAILGKTPYELLKDRKPTLDYFRVFRS
ncbi:retrovirus-related pol polyprotein from transposon TNT 1-94, partial [Tanacetum coccineum]